MATYELSRGSDVPLNVPISSWQASEVPELAPRLRTKLGAAPPSAIQRQLTPIGLAGRDAVAIAPTHDALALLVPLLSPMINHEPPPNAPPRVRSAFAGGDGRAKEEAAAPKRSVPATRSNVGLCRPRAIVVAPSRPLLASAEATAAFLCSGTDISYAVAGGEVEVSETLTRLREKSTALVLGTPGRLLDLIEQGSLDVTDVGYLCVMALDEVIDFGFEEQLRRIVNESHMPPPSKRRTTVSIGCPLPASDKSPLVGLLQPGILLRPNAIHVTASDAWRGPLRSRLVKQRVAYANEAGKMDRFVSLVNSMPGLVLCITRHRTVCELLAFRLREEGVAVLEALAEKLKPKERDALISSFTSGKEARVMVTTDAALRQLDESTSVSLPNVSHVVCYEVSPTMKEYAERVQRTGRGGHVGTISTIVSDDADGEVLYDLAQALREAEADVPRWLDGLLLTARAAKPIG